MYTREIRQKLNLIEDYNQYAGVEETYPERYCIIQELIYEGDYTLRCERCKFDFTKGSGPRSLGHHCNRPWMCT